MPKKVAKIDAVFSIDGIGVVISLLLGPRTEQIPFTEGRLHLGTYQGIFLVAFEGQCADEWMVTVVGV